MLIEEEGNIVTDSKYQIFCQQVNMKGVMGAGLARQIRLKYPEVFTNYINLLDANRAYLGSHCIIHTYDNRICICMYTQNDYGRNARYTDYKAFQFCLDRLAEIIKEEIPPHLTIAFPYKIGCGLGGGDWNIIRSMLEDFSTKVPNKVYVVHLPNT